MNAHPPVQTENLIHVEDALYPIKRGGQADILRIAPLGFSPRAPAHAADILELRDELWWTDSNCQFSPYQSDILTN